MAGAIVCAPRDVSGLALSARSVELLSNLVFRQLNQAAT